MLKILTGFWAKSFQFKNEMLFLKSIETHGILCYNFCVAHRYPATGGGDFMSILISFLVTVAAGVACHYIIKWLDSNDKGNK